MEQTSAQREKPNWNSDILILITQLQTEISCIRQETVSAAAAFIDTARGCVCAMATVIEAKFFCGLRGYHIYKAIWSPTNHELLVAKQETNNPHDRYAIAAYKQISVVGHLPKEILRFTWFIISHGASVTVKVVDVR